jgi:hypothetical protein
MGRNRIIAWIFFAFLLGMVSQTLTAQKLVFEKKIDSLPNHLKFGPNHRHFCHAFVSSSILLPSCGSSEIRTNVPLSGQIALGYRYKLKLDRPLSMVTECGINHHFFRISQNSDKTFPDPLIHNSQSIRTYGLFGGIFLRIRLGQRGDYLGNYVDIGLTGQSSLLNRLVTKDLIYSQDPNPYLSEKTTISRLSMINHFDYRASMRFGFDRFTMLVSYRLSRLVNNSMAPDLPGLEIGFEVSPVRY